MAKRKTSPEEELRAEFEKVLKSVADESRRISLQAVGESTYYVKEAADDLKKSATKVKDTVYANLAHIKNSMEEVDDAYKALEAILINVSNSVRQEIGTAINGLKASMAINQENLLEATQEAKSAAEEYRKASQRVQDLADSVDRLSKKLIALKKAVKETAMEYQAVKEEMDTTREDMESTSRNLVEQVNDQTKVFTKRIIYFVLGVYVLTLITMGVGFYLMVAEILPWLEGRS